MARYHFHTKDGRCLEDEEGTELRDLAAAKDVAVRVLTETLHGASDLFWEQEEFSVIVSDDTNLTLFTVNLTANYAPALRPPRPA